MVADSSSDEDDNVHDDDEDIVERKTWTDAAITKTETSADSIRSNVQDKASISIDSSDDNSSSSGGGGGTMKNANIERATINDDVTNSETVPTKTLSNSESSTETNVNTNTVNIGKMNVRNDTGRIVVALSNDNIESIRGRALNLTNVERKMPVAAGIVYVTAPSPHALPSSAMPRSSFGKAFSGDLSDVSMDADDSDEFNGASTSATATTTTAPSTTSIHESECQSKVRFLNIK